MAIILVIIAFFLVYIQSNKSKESSVRGLQTQTEESAGEMKSEDTKSTIDVNQVKTETPSQKTKSPIPSNWKVFKGYSISISAPSNFTVSQDTEYQGEISFGVSSPETGDISIHAASTRASYDKFVSMMDVVKPYMDITLIDDNYVFNGIKSTLYTMKSKLDESGGITSNVILIPSKLSYIVITPSMDSWKGYSRSDVARMIQSINLESGEVDHVSISYQRAAAKLLQTKERLAKLVTLGEIEIGKYSNEGHNPETDLMEPILFSVDGERFSKGVTFSFDSCKKDQAEDAMLKSYFTSNKKVIIQLPQSLRTYEYSNESYDNSNEFFFDSKNPIVVKDATGNILKEFSNLSSRCSPHYYQVWLPHSN